MGVSGQLHDPAALPSGERDPRHTLNTILVPPEMVWERWQREELFPFPRNEPGVPVGVTVLTEL
jgi:hypothetical protein